MGRAFFEFLFKYPAVAFSRGHLALAAFWPWWVLALAILGVTAVLGHFIWHRHPNLPARVRLIVWGLQSAVLGILLLLLSRPSLIVSTQLPQQNVVAILADDSTSMAMNDDGTRRIDEVRKVLDDKGPLLTELRKKFQLRIYRFSKDASKIETSRELNASGRSSHLQESIASVYEDLRHLPLAGIVAVGDGAENGSAGSQTLTQEMKARKIPVFTMGVGQEQFDRDVQIEDVTMPRAALPGSVIPATVTIRQRGYIGEKVRLEVRDGNDLLKSREIQFTSSPLETVPLNFVPRQKGLREYSVKVSTLPGEMVRENNSQSRLVEVQDRHAKILYIEGEPRWEYKFLRRSLDEDQSLRVVSLLKSSESKFYRQGIESPQELGETLPERKELFRYDGMVIGSINSAFFSAKQQEDIYEFVSKRGGGLLFLGGRFALADGGYQSSNLSELMPVKLIKPGGEPSFRRVQAKFEPTARGFEELQLAEDESLNKASWAKIPMLGNYQVTGEAKPGAVVLADAVGPDQKRYPVLSSQRFGRGRALVFATDGSWRWRMQLESSNHSPETFWRQMLHSVANDSPQQVSVSSDKPLYMDDQHVKLQAQVYDEAFEPVNGASVTATVSAPDGSAHSVPLDLAVDEDGIFRGEWEAAAPGVYRVEVVAHNADKEIGRGVSYFQRADGELESFSSEQNRSLLERISDQTGGKYLPISQASKLPEQLTFSPAGITAPEVLDLWDMPFWFLLLFLLKGAEWALRKHWRTI